MVRRRNNPWPAFSDLFSLLMLVTLGLAAVQFAEVAPKPGSEGRSGTVDTAWEEVKQLTTAIRRDLAESGSIRVHDCTDTSATEPEASRGNSTCLDLDLRFESNEVSMSPQQQAQLWEICRKIKASLDRLAQSNFRKFEVVIEGHTDSQPPKRASSQREYYLYNWNLSSDRAHSVLYEFKKCGLEAPAYKVVSLGYADSRPIPGCESPTPECNDRNRRTTLKLVLPYEDARNQ